MNYNRNKIIQMVAILALICVIVGMLSKAVRQNSMTLEDYANQNPQIAYQENKTGENVEIESGAVSSEGAGDFQNPGNAQTPGNDKNTYGDESNSPSGAGSSVNTALPTSTLVGASLNSTIPEKERTLYTEGFYYEPLSEDLRRYITGVSYPGSYSGASETASPLDADSRSSQGAPYESSDQGSNPSQTGSDLVITYDDLRYVHIWHYDFDGKPVEGELICNEAIARDLVEIFYELYFNEYQLEKVLLIDEYNGDDTASMEDNNTSCFNYRVVEGSASLSKHAYGLAIDINPLYNPYITYNKDGSEKVSPVSAQPYADRSSSFPYKIDEDDLCCRLFKEHGFTWGGNWNSSKDYQHFQKAQ